MSFSSINGINASRMGGLGGTRRPPLQPQQQAMPQAPTMPQGTGMMGSQPYAQPARAGLAGTMATGGGMTGVQPGHAGRPLQGPAPLQFDPNDPENAALAGYMNGA